MRQQRGQLCGNDPSGEASTRFPLSQLLGGMGCPPAGVVSARLPRAAASRGQRPGRVSRPSERLANGTGNRSLPWDRGRPPFKLFLAQEVTHQTACCYDFIFCWLPCLQTHKALFILLVRRSVDGSESGGIRARNVPGVNVGRLDNCALQ